MCIRDRHIGFDKAIADKRNGLRVMDKIPVGQEAIIVGAVVLRIPEIPTGSDRKTVVRRVGND